MSYRPITDMWLLARPKVKWYGAFPGGFLERARAVLGVSNYDPVLHVCSGRVRDYPYRGFGTKDKTLDLDPRLEPDYCQDAREPFPRGFSGILIDPPYTEADAEKYWPGKKALPTPTKLLNNGMDAVKPGGKVGILHYFSPAYRKENGKLTAIIGVYMGYNNRIRVFTVYEKLHEKNLVPNNGTKKPQRQGVLFQDNL